MVKEARGTWLSTPATSNLIFRKTTLIATESIASRDCARVTDNPEVIGWGAHLKAKGFRLELAHAGFPM